MSKISIKHIEINNFKGISHLALDFNERLSIFIGANGMGKSSILFCLSMALSRFIGRIKSLKNNGIIFTKEYIKNDTSESSIEVKMIYDGNEIQWRIGKQRYQTKQTISNLEEINAIVLNVNEALLANPSHSIPVVVFYGVSRNVLDVPLKIRTKHQFDQLAAYDGALLNERSINDFRLFFEWFRNREDIENENFREKSSGNFGEDFRDRQLNAVRTAIESILTGLHDLRVKRTPLRMVLSKNLPGSTVDVRVDQLSDGEKSTLSMVANRLEYNCKSCLR